MKEATGAGGGALKRAFRSLMTKLLLLLVVFLLVPIIIYMEFRRADQDKVVILMQSLREQGRLMAESLRPIIEKPFPTQLEELPKSVEKALPLSMVTIAQQPASVVIALREVKSSSLPALSWCRIAMGT